MEKEVVLLKKEIVQAWRNLKNDNLNTKDRREAYKNVVHLTSEIRKHDKDFSANALILGKYIEFKHDTKEELERKVKWTESKVITGLQKEYNYFIATALTIVSERHPDLDTDTDKFGTIINATVANLISLFKK